MTNTESENLAIILGIIMGALIMFLVTTIMPIELYLDSDELIFSNSTAHDICLHLTNNSAVQASADDGKLICSQPSYDHTQNIIIKSNAEDGR